MGVPTAPIGPPTRFDLRLSPEPQQSLVLSAPVLVNSFRFSGLRTVSEMDLAKVVAGWTGRVLSAAELNQVTHAVAEHLRATGLLIASAHIPPQEIRDGVVEIAVQEGRLGAVRLDVAPQARLRPGIAERFLEGMRPDDTIRADNVQQGLLLLNDLPGIRVDAGLATGARPETADLDVRVLDEGAPLSGALTLDNASQRTVGEFRASLALRWSGPLELGDLLAVRLQQTSGAGQTFASVTYGLPVNGLGTRIGVLHSAQRYELRKELTPLKVSGDYSATALLASHPILRRNDRNLTLVFAHVNHDYEDRFDAVGLRSDIRHRISTLALTYDSRDQWWGGGANLLQAQILSGEATQRIAALAALDAGPGGLNVFAPFTVFRFRAAREQLLAERTAIRVAINGQLASRNIDSGTAELVLGGPSAVRAYPVGELYADQGYVARIELRRAFFLSGESRTVLSAFHDQARAEINRKPFPGDPDNRRGLSAYGLGLAHDHGKNLTFESWLAWRGSERPLTAPDRTPRVWVSLTTRF